MAEEEQIISSEPWIGSQQTAAPAIGAPQIGNERIKTANYAADDLPEALKLFLKVYAEL